MVLCIRTSRLQNTHCGCLGQWSVDQTGLLEDSKAIVYLEGNKDSHAVKQDKHVLELVLCLCRSMGNGTSRGLMDEPELRAEPKHVCNGMTYMAGLRRKTGIIQSICCACTGQ